MLRKLGGVFASFRKHDLIASKRAVGREVDLERPPFGRPSRTGPKLPLLFSPLNPPEADRTMGDYRQSLRDEIGRGHHAMVPKATRSRNQRGARAWEPALLTFSFLRRRLPRRRISERTSKRHARSVLVAEKRLSTAKFCLRGLDRATR